MDDSKRLFIALAAPAEALPELVQWSDDHKPTYANLSWSHYANWHLTLCFLGETPIETIPRIAEQMRQLSRRCYEFRLDITGTGCFPDCTESRILWAGVEESSPLEELQEEVLKSMKELDISGREEPFQAHLTLARSNAVDLCSLANSTTPHFGRLVVNQIHLYESHEGKYIKMESFPLQPQ